MLISFAVTAKLICVFVFAYAKSRVSHDKALLFSHMCIMQFLSSSSLFCESSYFSDFDHIYPYRHLMPDIPGYPFPIPTPMILFQGQRAVIPCWTSTPNVTVKFMKDAYPPELRGPTDGVFWEPKLGFIIENPDRRFDGQHKCVTDYKTIFFSFQILCKYQTA